MQVNFINNIDNKYAPQEQRQAQTVLSGLNSTTRAKENIPAQNYRANFAPQINFTGNAPKIKQAYIITGEEKDVPLLVTKKNESYVIDFDSQTEIIYGDAAVDYLNKNEEFEYDTQVIFPKKAEGSVEVDGKTVELPENSAILINAGTKAKVNVKKGYPMMLVSKKDYDWYERYGKNAKDINIRNKFLELIWYNSHLYNGEFTPNVLLPEKFRDEGFLNSLGINKQQARNGLVYALYDKKDSLNEDDRKEVEHTKGIVDKLFEEGLVEQKSDGYLRFRPFCLPEIMEKSLQEKGFDENSIKKLMPIYKQSRQAKMDSRFALKNNAASFKPEYVERMKKAGILFETKKDTDHMYWREVFGNENDSRGRLYNADFNKDEENEIVEGWRKENLTGFDISGLKFINENMAVYNLNDKLNNWTHEKTNWVTNSTVLSSSEGSTPFVGVSMVQYEDKKPIAIKTIRSEEKLHAHPNLEEKRQTEIYVISSGAAILNVVKNGQSKTQLLKEGDLAVVGPGVLHCVNSILGEYEHIVTQVPSAFQYGFGFKQIVDPPADYDEQRLLKEAMEELENYQKETSGEE